MPPATHHPEGADLQVRSAYLMLWENLGDVFDPDKHYCLRSHPVIRNYPIASSGATKSGDTYDLVGF